MANKFTVLFQDNRSGWSETYYFSSAGSASIADRADNFVNNRVKVLGGGAKIIAVRAQDTTAPKKVKLFSYDRQGIAGATDGKTKVEALADQASVAVLMPYRSNRGTKRNVTLSGFPDAWMRRLGAESAMGFSGDAGKSVNPFYDYLLTNPWPLQIRERKIDGTSAPTNVDAITVHTDGRYKVTSTRAADLNPGDKVVLSKIKGRNLANIHGVRKVVAKLTDTTFTVDRGPRQDLGEVLYEAGGQVALVAYNFVTAESTEEPYVLTTRKRGRPFAQRRGRRSVAK